MLSFLNLVLITKRIRHVVIKKVIRKRISSFPDGSRNKSGAMEGDLFWEFAELAMERIIRSSGSAPAADFGDNDRHCATIGSLKSTRKSGIDRWIDA